MLKNIIEDVTSIKKRDPAAKSILEVILLYPGFHAIFFHRIANFLFRHKSFVLARLVSQISRFITLIEIHPGASIGRGLFIDHGTGVVIGETTTIGDYCTIYHGVTLGGTGKDIGKRHPTIGNNVLISTGAKVLGPIEIGDNSRIGANSVVLRPVEANTTVVGVPGKKVKKKNFQVISSYELDQTTMPDPVVQEMCKLLTRVQKIEKEFCKKNKTDDNEKKSDYGVF